MTEYIRFHSTSTVERLNTYMVGATLAVALVLKYID
jgi:hypothetical protein